jgi:hypothetical protein
MKPMSNLNPAIRFVKQLLKRPMRTSEDIQLRMLQHRLLTDLTYRLPNSAKRDLFIGFKEWKRILSRKQISKTFKVGEAFVLVSTSNQIDIAKDYISANTSKHSLNVLVREELSLPSYTLKFHILALRISLQCLFDSRRVNLALVIREVVEWAAVESEILAYQSNQYFDFTPFEKDSNALAYILIQKGIHVTKIPSPGPLFTHHSFIIGNEVIISSAYQLEEIPNFKNWNVDKINLWPPEQYHNYKLSYEHHPLAPKHTIGFYSHGEWVRRKEGHADPGLGILENEMFLLVSLRIFLAKNNQFKLIIFPHPKERNHPEFSDHYHSIFNETNYEIASIEMKSNLSFYEVNIGLMAYSTLMFERLAMGYKTLLGTALKTNFPQANSPLNNICVSDMFSLEEALLIADKETDEEFFLRNGLQNYPQTQFLEQKVTEIQK